MINIYCLIDPRNKQPFYVGATNGSIYVRLSGHITECKTYLPRYWSSKQHYMNDILIAGLKPKTRLLHTCSIHEAEHYELFFYNLLLSQGFKLLQKIPSGYKSKLDSEKKKRANYISASPMPVLFKKSNNNH
jgi:hypothetical protein